MLPQCTQAMLLAAVAATLLTAQVPRAVVADGATATLPSAAWLAGEAPAGTNQGMSFELRLAETGTARCIVMYEGSVEEVCGLSNSPSCHGDDDDDDGGDGDGAGSGAAEGPDPVPDEDCPHQWIGDNRCDIQCYEVEHAWDQGDCGADDASCAGAGGHWSGLCPPAWYEDGWCDLSCYTDACAYDGADCADYCYPGCPNSWLSDGWCDDACFIDECNDDEGDCANFCAPGCPLSWMGDLYCDAVSPPAVPRAAARTSTVCVGRCCHFA